MKKLILMIAMVVGVTGFAQEKKMEKKEISVKRKVERLTKELELTEEQQAQVKEIYIQQAERKRAEKAAFEEELSTILTPEQKEKLEAKKEERKTKRAERTERFKAKKNKQ